MSRRMVVICMAASGAILLPVSLWADEPTKKPKDASPTAGCPDQCQDDPAVMVRPTRDFPSGKKAFFPSW